MEPIMTDFKKAKLCYSNRQWSRAQSLLEKNSSLPSKDLYEATHLLAMACYLQGFFKKALKNFRKTLMIRKTPEALLNLSIVLNEIGHYTEAQKIYDQALTMHLQGKDLNWKEEMATKYFQLGQSYLQKNFLKSALKEFTKGLDFRPKKVEGLVGLAHTLRKLRKKNSAFKILKFAILNNPEQEDLKLLLAQWYFEDQNIPKAVNEWESILYQNPQSIKAKKALLHIQQITSPLMSLKT